MASMVKPDVSIIIPVYNVEKYLKKCVKSVQNQTLKNIEIICVNDGSTDASPQILRELAAKDTRIVVVDQKNAGAGAARNTGVGLVHADYFGFVDSDDELYPGMYEDMYKKAIQLDADMVISGRIETTFGEDFYFPTKNSEINFEDLEASPFTCEDFPELLQNVFLWNRLYSTKFWKKNELKIPENRKFAEDLLICEQTSVLAKRIGYVRGMHYRYRNVREDSLSYTLNKSQDKMDYLVAVRETKKFLKEYGRYDVFANDFLIFTTFLYIILLNKLCNYRFYKDFFCGMCDILDRDDFERLKTTWLGMDYGKLLWAMRKRLPLVCYTKKLLKQRFEPYFR